MTRLPPSLHALLLVGATVSGTIPARAAHYHHVQITAASPHEAVAWYSRYLDCSPINGRDEAAKCDGVELIFVMQPTLGSTQGTGVNHLAFSYLELAAKMAELEAVAVHGSGVRLQRFEDGTTLRDTPAEFRHGFIFDPWGTRIELLEDKQHPGFHHIHVSAVDPEATLAWYRDAFGGKPAKLSTEADGLRFGDVWLVASRHPEGKPAPTQNRAISHLGFMVPDLDREARRLRRRGVEFDAEPAEPANGRTSAKRAFVRGPDNVTVAVVEAGFAGIRAGAVTKVVSAAGEPFKAPLTPWGEPDLQGVWTGNAAHGIPLERPADLAGVEALTPAEAAARRERGTLGSIWGYEREWRDATLGFDKMVPSTQVAMIIDPPRGRLPARTSEGERLAAEARRARERKTNLPPAGPEDLTPYVRCVTRGLPGMMRPSIYNNGLQIVQGPGYVAIQKEMIHETRAIPTKPRDPLGPKLTSWLGDSQGHWDGDTLAIETHRFNGKVSFRGSTGTMTLTERFTRVGPSKLLHEFTVDDPTVWVRPWTAMFTFDLDDEQYELVEYACHERQLRHVQHLERRAREGQRGGAIQPLVEVHLMWRTLAVTCIALGLGSVVATDTVMAHHAFSSEFDATKPVRLRGTILKMEWINPHAWMHIEITNEAGEVDTWMIEAGPPGALVRRGWRKDSVTPGIEVLVEGYRAIDGRQKANRRDVTLPDGTRLFAGSSGTGAPHDNWSSSGRK